MFSPDVDLVEIPKKIHSRVRYRRFPYHCNTATFMYEYLVGINFTLEHLLELYQLVGIPVTV